MELISIEYLGSVSPDDKDVSDYVYLPVDLQHRCEVLEIEYSFDREGGCILDIGLLGPSGAFIGWSGSARSKIYVSSRYATPGYISSGILPGRYTIVLGLARIPRDGCRYKVNIKCHTSATILPEDHTSRWSRGRGDCHGCSNKRPSLSPPLKGDLHIHSLHSDGKETIYEIAEKALAKGLDFIAITDHNTISHVEETRDLSRVLGIPIYPGIEVTTYYGHINTYGVSWVDFRRRSVEDFKALLDQLRGLGQIAIANHPFDFNESCIGCNFKYKEILSAFDAIEVWNGLLPPEWNAHSVRLWQDYLDRGHRIPIVGGSDYHGPGKSELGSPTTWVYTDTPTFEGVIKAIKAGRAFVSSTPNGPHISLRAYLTGSSHSYTIGDTIRTSKSSSITVYLKAELLPDSFDMCSEPIARVITSEGVIEAIEIRGGGLENRISIEPLRGHKYVRVEIGCYSDPFSLEPASVKAYLAITNPIYITETS